MPGAFRPLTSRSDHTGAPALAAGRSVEQPIEQPLEQPRDFHFAVTWVTLFAHLNPIESAGPRRRLETPPPGLALVPMTPAPLCEQRADPDSNASWEMVVPKMVRSESGNFFPAESDKRRLL